MSTFELCEKYFATRDVYKLFGINRTADEKEIKKSYHKLSLLVHPDRVPEKQKNVATEKFKLLSKLYQVLIDKDKRALYDEQGIIDDEDENLSGKLNSWLELWGKLFQPITEEDINNYEKSYVGSELEKTDIKKAYLAGKGCINQMLSSVPFMKIEDEPRVQEIVREMIAAGEVPEYKIFTEEPEQKRKKRHKKYARESKEAEKIKVELAKRKNAYASSTEVNNDGEHDLQKAIVERMKSRENAFGSFIDKLAAKYGNNDDEGEAIDLFKDQKVKKMKKKSQKKSSVSNVKNSMHTVKTGKVKKREI